MKTRAILVLTMVVLLFGSASTNSANTASFQGLGDLAGGDFGSSAFDVSADGSTAVGLGHPASGYEAFRWTASDGMVGLGDLVGGVFRSKAYCVSADGAVVVGVGYSASGWEAFCWTESTGMQSLGVELNGVQAISADGSVLVGYGPNGAFRWTESDGMQILGGLHDWYECGAAGVSADGSVVVGGSQSHSHGPEVFIWDAANGMRNLKDLLVDNFGLDLTEWTLNVASGISADGSTIVGYGTNPDGNWEGWIVKLPELAMTYYVNAVDGNDNNDGLTPETAFATIQKAIDSAFDGDTVEVQPGTYTGLGNRDIDFLGKAITVRSENGPENCIIDCNYAGRGFNFDNGEDANSVLDGFTITKGDAPYGGGIACNGYSSPTIKNCTISGNSAPGGGGIYCEDSSPTITNCTINGNSARDGGGIYCWESNPTITNCTISGNSAIGGGGGIYCGVGNPSITNCTITANSAEWRGGGIYCYRSSPMITNCIIWDNSHQQVYGSASVTYSDVQGGWEGIGNIHAFPQFALANDYHLMPTSPCIDAGTNTPTGSLPPTDKDGVPRPLDGDGDANAVADMGAYEYAPNSPSIAVSAISFYFVQNWPKPDPQTLQIRNCGGRPLNWEITEDCSWLEVAPTNGVSTGQINEVTITVDPNGLMPGFYSCTFKVQDPDASNSPVSIGVTMPVGTVLRVPSLDLPTIQAAIDAARNYDVVVVADGNYTGEGNRDIDFLGKAITVRSESGPENCIIDCNGTEDEPHRGFYFHNNENHNAVVEGFTITNGNEWQGGGIRCDESSPTITNCNISDNTAERCGGGISCWESNPTISNCTINDNSALVGGGICFENSSAIITNCTISNNFAREGGGICCYDSSPTITNCTITGNTSTGDGGGIYHDKYGGFFTITNSTISGNYGGGIFNYMADDNSTFTNCIFWDNFPEQIVDPYHTTAVAYSNVQSGWEGVGNIDADPCFVQPGFWDANGVWVEGDYYLLPDSLCIDAGDPNYIPQPNETDLDGNPRVCGDAIDMGAYEAMVSCFGVNHVKLGTKAGKKGNKVELKGTFDPALPIDFAVDDVTYTIDDGLDYMLTFIIPAGSFEQEGKPHKQKFRFHSAKGSQPGIKAKFDFLKCKFELKVKEVMDTSEITAETLAIILQAGANLVEEVVQVQAKPKHLEFKREPKLNCCQM